MWVYFNELSYPNAGSTPAELATWQPLCAELAKALLTVGGWRDEVLLGFFEGEWHRLYAGRPFSAWAQTWLPRDLYRKLTAAARNIEPTGDLSRQVYLGDRATLGLSHAHIYETWAFGFAGANANAHSIDAVEHRLNAAGETVEQQCAVRNVCDPATALHWEMEFRDWGRAVAVSAEIARIGGFPIHMYSAPSEHGVPHVHLVDPDKFVTLAKFRVEPFQRMEGKPTWDGKIKPWVEEHRNTLLDSWRRCMAGGHPYKMDDVY